MLSGRRFAKPATAITASAFALWGCGLIGHSGEGATSSRPQRIVPGRSHLALTVGAPRSTEGRLLAQVYAQALRAAGYRVGVVAGLGGADAWPASIHGSLADARSRLARRGLVALTPASARVGPGVVMSRARAKALGIVTLSKLLGSGRRVRVAAPGGCAHDPACLPALRRAYGLRRVQEVRPDLVQDALRSGSTQAAIVPSIDPHLARDGERLLEDDRHALPDHRLTLVVRVSVARAAGPGLATAVAAAGSRLSSAVIAELQARVSFDELPVARVARQYLRSAGLVRGHGSRR
jgi:osmoprotectant transport system substrate-binding protein